MTIKLASPSWPRFIVTDEGDVIGPSGRTLRHFPDKGGYRRVNAWSAGSWTQLGVHFLVCEAFHGPRPEGHHVAHGDGDPGNNCADNLRWALPVENEADKVTHGTRAWCERHGMHKLTADEVRAIRATHEDRRSGYRATADKYGVTVAQICNIVNRKSWKALS